MLALVETGSSNLVVHNIFKEPKMYTKMHIGVMIRLSAFKVLINIV